MELTNSIKAVETAEPADWHSMPANGSIVECACTLKRRVRPAALMPALDRVSGEPATAAAWRLVMGTVAV
ncbi:hypothetical protein CRT60_25525 [Azospirillum palustre]|uniref:Uncharacterized protein n=1 Tax=Azospirillum palustre TaxID=2044885 RepID=A0A2B8AWE0_9PROT|nr:hypothetical protein CRT60_25525 [Azospirillum palustre]